MILTIDVGNTNIVLGVYKYDELIAYWRMRTDRNRSSDEIGIFMTNLFRNEGLEIEDLKQVIIASVVPDIMYSLDHAIRKYLKIKPLIIGPGIKTGLKIKMENPKELGADRIVNAIAALQEYGAPAIVIDFGTATTYDVIDEEGAYAGGVIAPGIKISANALWENAAKLPKIEIERPKRVIGKNTVDSMKAGLLYGYVGQVDYLVEKIKNELSQKPVHVIATGGLSRMIAPESSTIEYVDTLLTIKGLKMIYEKNCRG